MEAGFEHIGYRRCRIYRQQLRFLDWLNQSDEPVINLDKLTYAGNLENLASLQGDPRHIFIRGDIGDAALVPRMG